LLMCAGHLVSSRSHILLLFFSRSGDHRPLHSFPTRRSSDLNMTAPVRCLPGFARLPNISGIRSWTEEKEKGPVSWTKILFPPKRDRKSTRLNSSHVSISYAVFCLKKKNTQTKRRTYERKNHQ